MDNELFEKITMLREQALNDDRLCLAELFNNLLNNEETTNSFAEFIISISDDMSEDLARFFLFLIHIDMDENWYSIVQVIYEESNDFKEYADTLKKCKEIGLSADDVTDIYEKNKTADEFNAYVNSLVEKKNVSEEEKPSIPEEVSQGCDNLNEEIKKLQKENKELLSQNANLTKELSETVVKYKDTMDMSLQNKQLTMKLKIDLNQAEQTRNRSESELKMMRNKIEKNEQLISSLKQINQEMQESIESEKENRQPGNDQLVESLRKENARLQEQIASMELEISTFEREIAQLKKNTEPKLEADFYLDAEMEIPEQIEDEPGQISMDAEVPIEQFGNSKMEEPVNVVSEIQTVKNNFSDVVKHANIFAKLFAKHYEKVFCKNTEVNQISIINAKIIENGLDMEKAMVVRNYLANKSIPKVEIYRLVVRNASLEEFMQLKDKY